MRKLLSFLLSILILPVLLLINCFHRIRIGQLQSQRIGHLCEEPDLFLRRVSLQEVPAETSYFMMSPNPANWQIQKMLKRHLNIIENILLSRMYFIVLPYLKKTKLHQEYPGQNKQYREYHCGHNNIKFTEEEEIRGRRELARMGIGPDDWFICVHARDPAYFDSVFGQQKENIDFRDCRIDNFIPAMKYLADLGGYVLRMGSVVEKPLGFSHAKIIDYATHFRSDFMDAYLSARCRFFLGSNSGLYSCPMMFDRPVGISNYLPLSFSPVGRKNIWLPKYFREKTTGRLLNFDEAKEIGLFNPDDPDIVYYSDGYKIRGIECLDNDQQDILDLALDLADMADGKELSVAEKELQQAYFRSYVYPYEGIEFAAPIGIRFLLRRRWLLGISMLEQAEELLRKPEIAIKLTQNITDRVGNA